MPTAALIKALVGPAAYARGRVYADQGRVEGVADRPVGTAALRRQGVKRTLVATVRGSRRSPYICTIQLGGSRAETPLSSTCTCPVGLDCKHVAAALLEYSRRIDGEPGSDAGGAPATAAGRTPASRTQWEKELGDLAAPAPPRPPTFNTPPIGLQVSFTHGMNRASMYSSPDRVRRGAHLDAVMRVGLRPLTQGRSGRWIRTGISWNDIASFSEYQRNDRVDALRALFVLAAPTNRYQIPDTVWLDQAPGAAVWAALVKVAQLDIPFLSDTADRAPIEIATARASTAATISARPDGGLELVANFHSPDADLDAALKLGADPIGIPAHGLAIMGEADKHAILVPTENAVDSGVLRLIKRRTPLMIPADDTARFYEQSLPALSARIDHIEFVGGNEYSRPTPILTFVIGIDEHHNAQATARWRYCIGAARVAEYAAGDPALVSPDDADGMRDRQAESAVWHAAHASAAIAGLLGRIGGAEGGVLRTAGEHTASLVARTLPAIDADIEGRSDIRVERVGAAPRYRIASDMDVTVSADQTSDRDWFSLRIRINVAGKEVPMVDVFTALARGADEMLVDGVTLVSLSDPRLDRLREAIETARQMQDARRDEIRVGRFNVQLFEELDDLGLLDDRADLWRSRVGSLRAAPAADAPIPATLHATLREYQDYGYQWLAYRIDRQLGGILADDMGLGKTLQTLAAIARQRERHPDSGPFLVVAPTSVVGNWSTEARKFAPSLVTRTVESTQRRRGSTIAEVANGADIVVTSYALLRLEAPAYNQIAWSGMIVDEAQFVKNHNSVGYRTVRDLPAPVKIALTGTPLENNLMELWSIMSIVCPGLLPDAKTFSTRIEKPISKDHDTALIGRLRGVIAPFVLRRTKEVVAGDLPEKIEQVTDVVLNARHRKVYDLYLQRERGRVLGLVENLDQHRIEVLRSLSILRQASLDVSLVDEEHAQVASSKLEVLFEMLSEILADGHNVLIFSQFTRFLGKVRNRLSEMNVEHAYLDGRTRNRSKQIERFTNGDAQVFLISLKAGGFGLNLTSADYCILLDPWWNPAAEAQAVDRAHRIGQTRQVMVYRLVSVGTIEQKVMALKADKSALFSAVVDGGDPGEQSKVALSKDDIRALIE
ncbi:DEAD/DEAH box helicase [Rarobacter incanus]|uniref:SNF2 family DNA or RNA helicase n=1 Tax=Rarobacter incanus TaxID=153494 RepID=A0A542SPE7_9MICO|nr:DEAD/DEAH box helicase [Rarobacter incanus]TQK76494.1 SNF2 family DNA or RNA helicase [Rarobacter incanus]